MGGPEIFTDEQRELRVTARRFLDEKSTSEHVRELMETDAGFGEAVWKEMAALGWTGIAIPEKYGGLGYGFMELSVLLEEMGKSLLCAPFFSSTVLAANAVLNGASEEQKKSLLPSIADGSIRATLAFVEAEGVWDGSSTTTAATAKGDSFVLNGTKHYVIDGSTAELLLVLARRGDSLALFSVDPNQSGVKRTAMVTLDATRKQARIEFDGSAAQPIGGDAFEAALSTTLNQAALALAAESLGGAQRCLDVSVEYAKNRIQFGRPIGSFQAIKHRATNLLMEVENARSAAYYAAWTADNEPEDLPLAASMAKAYCSDAFSHAAADNIQIHGGIGFTWEHDAHLYLRRAKSNEIYLGDATYHRELLATRIGI